MAVPIELRAPSTAPMAPTTRSARSLAAAALLTVGGVLAGGVSVGGVLVGGVSAPKLSMAAVASPPARGAPLAAAAQPML